MKKMYKKRLLPWTAAALIGTFGMNAAVHANPANYITGPFEFKYVNYEFATAPSNEVNIGGIFSISSINPDGVNVPFWVPGPAGDSKSDGTELNGFFSSISITSGTNPNFKAIGGLLAVYNVGVGLYDGATFDNQGINTVDQLCGGGACPDPWLTALFVPGIEWLSGDSITTLSGNFDTTNPISGDGKGYLSVADIGGMDVINGNSGGNFTLPASFVGTENATFDTNGWTFSGSGAPAAADLLLGSRFFQCGFGNSPPSCNTVDKNQNTAASDDPVRGIVRVPEPGIIALLGLGLIGLVGSRRRRKTV